jgi:F-type H+-transporting ATPase subunit c
LRETFIFEFKKEGGCLEMKKKIFMILLAVLAMTLLSAVSLFAGEGGAGNGYAAIGAGFAIAIGAFGGAIGIGMAGLGALLGLARNPAVGGKIMTYMIISMALSESCAIYSLVIAFMLYGKA